MNIFTYDETLSPLVNACRLAQDMGFDTEQEFDAFVDATVEQWKQDAMQQDTTLYISEEKYDELAEQFNLYYYESGMSGEMDCDYATAEWNYISNELGTSDWNIK